MSKRKNESREDLSQDVANPSPHKKPSIVIGANAFTSLLARHSAESIMTKNDLLVIDTSDQPVAAFQKLVARHVLSAPVFNSSSQNFISFLDTRDLVSYMVFKYEQEHPKSPPSSPFAMGKLIAAAARMHEQPLAGITVQYLSMRNVFVPVKPTDSLLDVVMVLAAPNVHRVPVVDNEQLVGIISQSNVARFIQAHRDELKDMLNVQVGAAGVGTRTVTCVSETDTALKTFSVMSKRNLGSVPVVTKDGTFVANTSGSDLKLLLRHMDTYGARLSEPILDYLAALRQERPADMDEAKTKSPTIVCHDKDTVLTVINRIVASHIHKLFQVDAKRKIQGVISITDLLGYLLGAGGSVGTVSSK